jgi:hypothetical protein
MVIFATLSFMMQLKSALLTIKYGGVLNDVQYTLFQLKISISYDTYSQNYNIGNYPLIPILAGVLYNIYIIVKKLMIKDKIDN